MMSETFTKPRRPWAASLAIIVILLGANISLPAQAPQAGKAATDSCTGKPLDALLKKVAAYKYGQDRLPLAQLIDCVREAGNAPALRPELEKRLDAFLQGKATDDGTRHVTEQLSIIGTAASVPVLSGMLLKPSTSDMARYALERIQAPEAGEALRAGLAKASNPIKIGIVTSIDGAALRDILKVLRRRYPNAHVIIAPTRVQGETAAADIARALGEIGRVEGVDVVIVGRGGGAIEDLWAFNEEPVARAIAGCPVPVISAVGHETDVTLSDLVADLRAPTPSAAAEIVVSAKNEFVARIDSLGDRLSAAADRRVRLGFQGLQRLVARPAFAGFPARLALRGRHVAELLLDLQRAGRESLSRRQRAFQSLRLRLEVLDLRRTIGRIQARLSQADARLKAAIVHEYHGAEAHLGSLAARLDSLSPLAVLGRGYAVCWDGERQRIVREATSVGDGDAVRVTLHRGELHCVVTGRDLPGEDETESADGTIRDS
jgi:exodeoxyribonuclease VII large subunit